MAYTRRLSVQDVKIITLNLDSTGNVAVSATDEVTVQAPAGYMYEVVAMKLQVNSPGGTAAGSHHFNITSLDSVVGVTQGISGHASALHYNFLHWLTAGSTQYPPDALGQELALSHMLIDATNGIKIQYYNGTDVIQAGTRTIRLTVKKTKVV